MWKFDNIKTGVTEIGPLYPKVKAYILEKNLNFILARGNLLNGQPDGFKPGELETLLDEFSACHVSMTAWSGDRPSPPFLAADINPATRTARVRFLMDLTREAMEGQASPFYSKILGALATQFFAGQPEVDSLWFPFDLMDTVGRGLTLAKMDGGTMVIRKSSKA